MDEKKSRHIVTWTEEEDNILREKHHIYGERWSTIASYLKNKTSRQCRRRLSAYLSADSKKGSWSEEEDKLLLEAHKKIGNRWTEIAKVVSGRTDNAVKNRFHALINKQARCKENNQPVELLGSNTSVLLDNKVSNASIENSRSCKRLRISMSDSLIRNCHHGEVQSILQPRKVLGALPNNNLTNIGFTNSSGDFNMHKPLKSATKPNVQVTHLPHPFLNSEHPKLSALAQKAELLKTLAQKLRMEVSNPGFEDLRKERLEKTDDKRLILGTQQRDFSPFLGQSTGCLPPINDDQINRLHIHSMPELYELCETSSQFSESSNQSVNLSIMGNESLLENQTPRIIGQGFQVSPCISAEIEHVSTTSEDGTSGSASVHAPLNQTEGIQSFFHLSLSQEFNSPLHVNPVFENTASGICSPQFSESEKQFLLNLIPTSSETSERCWVAHRNEPPRPSL